MESIAHFLINLTGILISLLVLQYFMTKHYVKRTKIHIVIFITITVSILSSMLFPLRLSNGIVFDLRFIPFIIGCFYANRHTKYWMILLIIALRLYQGVGHSWFGITNILLFYLLSNYLGSYFELLSRARRIFLFTILTLVSSVWSAAGANLFFHAHIDYPFFITYVLIQTGGMFIVSYMLESIIGQYLLLHEIVKMKKLEVVSHLTASISHEIRNPLTSTRGFLQLISESAELPSTQKSYIDIALKELDHADSIIRSYLTFAKPSPEKLVIIDVENETNRILKILEPLAKMNCVEVQSHLEASQILGDEGLFQQALVNIIQNGIESMPAGGLLSINGCVQKSTSYITISDEGIGMSESQISRLGEPYYTTKDAKGTGLGMMVVFRIIESMNGRIHVESKLGKGTKITLQFPTIH